MKKYIIHTIFLPVTIILVLVLASCTESSAPIYKGPDIQILGEQSVSSLEMQFKRYGYQLDNISSGVPPIILRNLPEDLGDISSSHKRKSVFVRALLPMVLLANNEIRAERNLLEKIKRNLSLYQRISDSQQHALDTLAARYRVDMESTPPEQVIKKLEQRIDIVPADLALAQAANESAWGTSRFSRVANNLFGEWTFQQGQGIVPTGRPEGETYEIEKFNTVYDSVRSYLHNLNTHRAYRDFRLLRSEMRQAGDPLDGISLSEGLLRYSTRGEEYIKEIQVMIRHNKFFRYTSAKLRKTSV